MKFLTLAEVFPWRNRIARSVVNRKVGGARPPGEVNFAFTYGPYSQFFRIIYSKRGGSFTKCYHVAKLSCSPLIKIAVVTVVSGFAIQTRTVGPFSLYRLLLTH